MPWFLKHNAPLRLRLTRMLLGWGSAGLAYHIGRRYTGDALVIPETALDTMITFNPHAVWLYLSFFILMPYAYMTCNLKRLLPLQMAMQFAACISGLIFVLCPTTLVYPNIMGENPSISLLKALLWVDSSKNCLPSLHASLTLISVWALWQPQRIWHNAFCVIWGILITYSIIQLRRHLSLDVGAGLIVGLLAIAWLNLPDVKAKINPEN